MVEEVALTREQLYEQVWNAPMTKVAARLGLSDVGLAKICYQAEIPVPPRGYWAKIRNGKRAVRRKLRPIDEPIEFVFRPQTKPATPKAVEPEYPPEVIALIDAAKNLPKIMPRTDLIDLHPLVERTRLSLGRCKLDERPSFKAECLLTPEPVKGRPVLNAHVGKDSVRRALLILDALLRVVETIGGQFVEVKEPRPEIRLRLLGEDVGGVSLSENRRQIRNPKWSEREWLESRTILVPGGDLTFASTATYVENTARDTPKHRLEESLNKIIVRWAVNAGRLPGERRIAEERAAKYAEEERLRQELEARRQRLRLDFADRQRAERERVEKLKLLAARWQESQQIRAYVAAVAACDQAVHDDDRSQWCDWAMKQADRLDPLVDNERSILDMTFEEYDRQVTGEERPEIATATETPRGNEFQRPVVPPRSS
ncbi:MAG: hypothetical protein J0M17_11135 [Planctomycetes bacterium]|nr:hypothetical protein [Planctomycetota bacterium]